MWIILKFKDEITMTLQPAGKGLFSRSGIWSFSLIVPLFMMITSWWWSWWPFKKRYFMPFEKMRSDNQKKSRTEKKKG